MLSCYKKWHYDFDFQQIMQINYITGNGTILLFCYDDDNRKNVKKNPEIMNKSDNKKIYYKTDIFVPNMCNTEMAGFIGVFYHYI